MPSRAANWPGRVYGALLGLCGRVIALGRSGFGGRARRRHAPHRRPIVESGRAVVAQRQEAGIGHVAREVVVIPRVVVVGVHRRPHRVHHGEVMGLPREQGEMLAEPYARRPMSRPAGTVPDTRRGPRASCPRCRCAKHRRKERRGSSTAPSAHPSPQSGQKRPAANPPGWCTRPRGTIDGPGVRDLFSILLFIMKSWA